MLRVCGRLHTTSSIIVGCSVWGETPKPATRPSVATAQQRSGSRQSFENQPYQWFTPLCTSQFMHSERLLCCSVFFKCVLNGNQSVNRQRVHATLRAGFPAPLTESITHNVYASCCTQARLCSVDIGRKSRQRTSTVNERLGACSRTSFRPGHTDCLRFNSTNDSTATYIKCTWYPHPTISEQKSSAASWIQSESQSRLQRLGCSSGRGPAKRTRSRTWNEELRWQRLCDGLSLCACSW